MCLTEAKLMSPFSLAFPLMTLRMAAAALKRMLAAALSPPTKAQGRNVAQAHGASSSTTALVDSRPNFCW